MSGSVGQKVRPSQTAAGRARVSRSVGSPDSGGAAWAATGKVGRVSPYRKPKCQKSGGEGPLVRGLALIVTGFGRHGPR